VCRHVASAGVQLRAFDARDVPLRHVASGM
jgi:hypothetical protein